MIIRRQLLIGSAAGLILPNWLLKAEKFIQEESLPYLEPPTQSKHILSAFGDLDSYTLYLDYDPDNQLNFT